MITVSAGEFAATITKACLGAGVERGIALELGPACMELSLLGQRPVPVLIEQLEAVPSNTGSDGWTKAEDRWAISRITMLPDAASMIDFATISEAVSQSTNAPVLILGLALNRMRCHDLRFEISLDDGPWTNLTGAMTQFSENMESCSMVLRHGAGSSGPRLPNIVAINVSDEDWSSLAPWVAKTLVKADETNRADAGAGNTDND